MMKQPSRVHLMRIMGVLFLRIVALLVIASLMIVLLGTFGLPTDLLRTLIAIPLGVLIGVLIATALTEIQRERSPIDIF